MTSLCHAEEREVLGRETPPENTVLDQRDRGTERFNSRVLPDHQVARSMDFSLRRYLSGVRPLCKGVDTLDPLSFRFLSRIRFFFPC